MLTFRGADAADIDPVVALVTSAYRGDASRVGWTTEADLLEGQRLDAAILADDLADPAGLVLLAHDGDELVACCHLTRKGASDGYFGMFAVSPTRQGSGLGKAVMAEAERIARDDWGLPGLEMTVIEQRADLLAFYERRGFVRTGETRPFPYGDERMGVPLRDDLRFVVLRKPL